MEKHEFQGMFLAAGLPEDQIDSVLNHFLTFGYAPKIRSLSDYATATTTYAMMDARVHPDDAHSFVGRYLVSLGPQIAHWDDKIARLNSRPVL